MWRNTSPAKASQPNRKRTSQPRGITGIHTNANFEHIASPVRPLGSMHATAHDSKRQGPTRPASADLCQPTTSGARLEFNRAAQQLGIPANLKTLSKQRTLARVAACVEHASRKETGGELQQKRRRAGWAARACTCPFACGENGKLPVDANRVPTSEDGDAPARTNQQQATARRAKVGTMRGETTGAPICVRGSPHTDLCAGAQKKHLYPVSFPFRFRHQPRSKKHIIPFHSKTGRLLSEFTFA